MINILLIANQQRLQELVSAAASAGNASVRIAPDLGQCAAEVSGAAPDMVFLQNRLSGLSADILLRHVKSLLSQDATVSFVLLCESPTDPQGELFIDIAGTDDEIRAAVDSFINAEISRRSPEVTTQEAACPTTPSADAEHAPPATAVSTVGEEPLPHVVDAVSITGTDISSPSVETREPAPLRFDKELDTLMGRSAVPLQEDGPSAMAGSTVGELLSRPSPRNRKVRWIGACAVGVAVVAGFAFYNGTRRSGKQEDAPQKMERAVSPVVSTLPPSPKVSSQPSVKPVPLPPPSSQGPAAGTSASKEPAIRKAVPPSFIPRKYLVHKKVTADGEWEKYVSPAAEYRVFRSGTAIKAVQVIDRTGKGITRAFFSRAIHEMAGVKDYILESRETKGNILVKKGRLSRNARVILYKRNADTFLQAFVIQYD